MSVASSSMIEPTPIISDVVDESIIEADPDEPRYCVCNEVAYGDMVACDYKKVRRLNFSFSTCVQSVSYMVCIFSAPTSGITTDVLESLVHPRETGTAHSVLWRWKNDIENPCSSIFRSTFRLFFT